MNKFVKRIKGKISLFLVHMGYLLCGGTFLFHTIFFVNSLYRVDYSIHNITILQVLGYLLVLPLFWFYSTRYDFYNYHYIKIITFSTMLAYIGILILSLVYKLLSWICIPAFLRLETNDVFTKNMVIILCRVVTQLPLLLFSIILFRYVLSVLRIHGGYERLMGCRLSHYWPASSSPYKTVSYPMSMVKDMRTGRKIKVPMKDRFLHTLVAGSSGTAKTSSTILPVIKDDLDNRCKAEDQIKEGLYKLIQTGVIAPLKEDRWFTVSELTILKEEEKTKEILESLYQQNPVCGVTVLAPEDSLTDAVCQLCEARGITYNCIDPVRLTNGEKKKHWIGMNPFYISSAYKETARDEQIIKRAIIFADVMQAITDLKGSSDSYFTGINRQMLCNVSILSMITVPLHDKRQATPGDLQIFINNFDSMLPYFECLEKDRYYREKFYVIYTYVKNELLGKGRVKMEDQCRGTRNIINEFLLQPANREIYCAQESIDFDSILSGNEITVCNFNLAAGDTEATTLGLTFFQLFNNAILSRPGTENTRSPHFWFTDELPVLLHPSLEKNFTLFRKFRVGMLVAIQTLDQFEKNEMTKYLKGVVLGCANIVVFGRTPLSDMEQFSKLAGMEEKVDVQTSISETALSNTNTQLSYSARDTVTSKSIVDETKIRMKDFQEVTYFPTISGRPLPPVHGKVQFLNSKDWEKRKRPVYNIYETEPIVHTVLKADYVTDTLPALDITLKADYETEDTKEEAVVEEDETTADEGESIEDLYQ